jgi:hypothetical protein
MQMNEQDYALMLDIVYGAWSRCEALFLLTAERILEGEIGLDAQLVQCREHCERALRDLTTLRSQAHDVSPGTTKTRHPARFRWNFESRKCQFTVNGTGSLDAAL